MSELASRSCTPCKEGTPPMPADEAERLAAELDGWEVVDGHHLRKHYDFPDFVSALAFVNRLGEVAEAEGHHPDIVLGYGKVEVEVFTHAAGGLTENDFILAAKADRALGDERKA